MKKLLSVFLVMCFIFSLTACSGSNTPAKDPSGDSSDKTSETDQSGSSAEIENIVFAWPTTATVDGIQMVEDEINKIIEPKIGVHVTFAPISIASYTEQVGLMLSAGDQLDVMTFLGTYSSMLSKHQLKEMDEYIDKYGAEAKKVIGDEFLKATSANGHVYAFPTLNGKAAVPNIVLEKKVLEDNNISLDGLTIAKDWASYVKNLDELTKIFAQMKAAVPDKVCLVAASVNPNTLMNGSYIPQMDNLSDFSGVLMAGDDKKVVNYFATEEYATLLSYIRDWYEKGYILSDAATSTEAPNTYIKNGRSMGYFVIGEEGQAEQITTATGVEVVATKLMEATITTGSINSLGFGIASTSEHPEAAMKFLNEMYTNADIINLLDWGVEGVHYVVNDDGTVGFPEGVDATNSTYNLNEDWLFGNQFLGHIWGKGRDTTIYERLDYNNRNSYFTPALGFSYDSTTVTNEITAITNVVNQYRPGLETGTVDPDTELPKFLEALKTAGIDKVIAEKQKQLDAWYAAQ